MHPIAKILVGKQPRVYGPLLSDAGDDMGLKIYKMITPSDPLTFLADDDKIAIAATIILGRGMAGLEEGERDLSGKTLFLFATKEYFDEQTKATLGSDLAEFFKANRVKLADAFDSFATMTVKERRLLEEAKAHMSAEEFAKFRAKIDDEYRSSLNRWSEYAWDLAKTMRANKEGNNDAVIHDKST